MKRADAAHHRLAIRILGDGIHKEKMVKQQPHLTLRQCASETESGPEGYDEVDPRGTFRQALLFQSFQNFLFEINLCPIAKANEVENLLTLPVVEIVLRYAPFHSEFVPVTAGHTQVIA